MRILISISSVSRDERYSVLGLSTSRSHPQLVTLYLNQTRPYYLIRPHAFFGAFNYVAVLYELLPRLRRTVSDLLKSKSRKEPPLPSGYTAECIHDPFPTWTLIPRLRVILLFLTRRDAGLRCALKGHKP